MIVSRNKAKAFLINVGILNYLPREKKHRNMRKLTSTLIYLTY